MSASTPTALLLPPIISNFVDNFHNLRDFSRLSNYSPQTSNLPHLPHLSDASSVCKGNGKIEELTVPHQPSESANTNANTGKTAIVFDWDDTLLPKFLLPYISSMGLNSIGSSNFTDNFDDANSTAQKKTELEAEVENEAVILGVDIKGNNAVGNGGLLLDLEQLEELAKLDELIFDIFTRILDDPQLHLYLVTNSKSGWIELSSKRFLPQLHNFITKHNNDRDHFFVISARSTYELIYPGDPIAWKVATFDKIVGATRPSQLISYGDGVPEKQATELVSKKYAIPGKSVQFLPDPATVSILVDQLELVESELDKICAYPESFALSIIAPE